MADISTLYLQTLQHACHWLEFSICLQFFLFLGKSYVWWNTQMLIMPFNEFWQTNTTQASIKILNIAITPESYLLCLLNPCNHCFDLLSSCHRWLILLILEHHINRIMQCIYFCMALRLCFSGIQSFFPSQDYVRVCLSSGWIPRRFPVWSYYA